jgi:hypothetical protein
VVDKSGRIFGLSLIIVIVLYLLIAVPISYIIATYWTAIVVLFVFGVNMDLSILDIITMPFSQVIEYAQIQPILYVILIIVTLLVFGKLFDSKLEK